MVLPLFLFCFLNLFSILNIYSLQTTLMAALRETGQDLCVYGYAYERMVQEEDDEGLEAFAENIAFSYSYVKYGSGCILPGFATYRPGWVPAEMVLQPVLRESLDGL